MSSVNLPIFVGMTVVFVAITLFLGYYGYKNTKSSQDYLLGNKKTSPVIIALSYGATFLSASAVIGFGGQAAVHGLSLMWLCFLNLAIGVIVAFLVFGRRTRRLGNRLHASTFADLLGKVYKSRGIRLFTAVLIIVMMPIYCAAVLKGGVNSLHVITGLDYNIMLLVLSAVVAVYVVYGGIVAVMYNDALQAVVMFAGMLVIFGVTVSVVGPDGFQQLSDMYVSGLVNTNGVLPGWNGWTSVADFGSAEWLVVVSTFLLGVGIGALTQPQLIVRFMSSKDDRALNKSMLIGCIFILVIVGSAYTVGTLSNVYFMENYGMTAFDYVAQGVDFIIPTYIIEVFHNITFGDVFVSLFLLSLLCASVSTISALMHTIGGAGGYDIFSVWKSRKEGREVDSPNVNLNRIVTVVMMVVVVVYCYLMPSDIIAKATSVFMGVTASALLPTYVQALYAKNPDRTAAIGSIAVGTASYLFWALFVNAGTSKFLPICQMLTGSSVLFDGLLMYVDPMMVALPLSVVALLVVRAVSKRSASVPEAVSE